ncbi:hypothetical protein B0181_11580 [Moraxella caviae]|uniref:Phage tail protein n=1 Tax=Moraxella caviae TaxID=34060 RepID=A0A1S9ZT95_9GAMM|nr:phage tail tube protein [Moraxella caviae]OOR86633.1 hypothetical protein B0181_11580 [Moraxella caviae]STZ14521.1 Uncharacterised protein [Moraxella caviae]VEW11299.1 Uncharacterised protein [Moraxella caviae]
MSSGAKVVTAIAKQTDIKKLATTGFKILPNKSNGLNNSIELTESELVSDSRLKREGMPTGGTVEGDIETELMFGVFDELIAAAFWSEWKQGQAGQPDTLEVGDTRSMFTITKDFTDIGVFHAFGACHVNSLSLDVGTDSLVSLSLGFKGLDYQHSKTTSFAKTPKKAEDSPKASGLNIGDILIDGQNIGVCVEAFKFEIDNGAEVQKCLGDNKYGGNVLAMFATISGSMTIAYSPKAHDILTNQITGATLAVQIPIEFENGKKYILKLPKVQISGDIPSPSGSDLVTAEVSFNVVGQSPVLERYTA